MNPKHIITILLLLICSGTASAWLSYDHRIPITVNNGGASTLTDYQFNFTNDTNALVAAGHLQASGADCRVTDSSDNLIPFWNETAFNAAGTKIWANGTLTTGDNTFYMYYGNSGASDVSDIATTFMFGDDFSNDSKLAWLGGQYTTFNDGYVTQSRVNSGDAAWNGVNITDGWVEVTVNITSDDGSANDHHAGPYFRICAPGGTGYDNYVFMSDAYYNNVRLVKQVGGPETILDTVSATINYNQDYVLRAEFTGTRIVCYLDGVEKINLTDPDLAFGRTGVHIYDCVAKFTEFSAYDGTTTYTDDFSYSTLLAGQDQTYSIANYDDNRYVIEDGVLNCIGRYGQHTELHYFGDTFSDYIIESKITTTEDPNAFGLSLRSADSANYYGQMCRGGTDDYIRSFKFVSGSFSALTQTAKAFEPSTEYSLKSVANGNSLKTYVDNTLYLTDTDSSFASGYVGFYHHKTNVSYDDFRVRQYTATEPTSSLGAEEDAPSNNIILGANQHGMLQKTPAAAETFSTIAAGIDHDRCYTWWDSTADRWESYRVGYSYNAAKSVPEHDSYFVLMDGTGTTVSCSIAAAETVAIPSGYYATYLRESTAKTLSAIKTDMGGNVNDLWAFDPSTGAWTDTGTFSVLPNQGLMVNSSVGFNWDGTVP